MYDSKCTYGYFTDGFAVEFWIDRKTIEISILIDKKSEMGSGTKRGTNSAGPLWEAGTDFLIGSILGQPQMYAGL